MVMPQSLSAPSFLKLPEHKALPCKRQVIIRNPFTDNVVSWIPAFAGMTKTFFLILFSGFLLAQESPHQIYQEIRKLHAEIQMLEESIAHSHAREKELKQSISETLPLLIRYARRNPLELLARPRAQHEIARERALVASVSHHLNELNQMTRHNTAEQKLIHEDDLKTLAKKKTELAALTTQQRTRQEDEQKRLIELEQLEKKRLFQKKLSVNELLNESREALGKKPILPDSAKDLPILRLETPVQGKIVGLYDIQKKYSPHSKGVVFEGTKGGLIVAPAHGVVKYVGKFRDHDPIIILNHGEKTTTILIGAETVSVQPEQSVYMGQTLGKFPGYGTSAPRLYMEFRNEGKYIDPTPFFSDNAVN